VDSQNNMRSKRGLKKKRWETGTPLRADRGEREGALRQERGNWDKKRKNPPSKKDQTTGGNDKKP